VEHVLQILHRLARSLAIGLVNHEHVRDLEDACLRRLDGVAPAGCNDDERGIGSRGDLHLGLPNSDSLDHDQVGAAGIQDSNRLRCGQRQAAEMPTRGHRTDEHLRVGCVRLHPQPITEQRTACEGRGWVDRQDRHRFVTLPRSLDQLRTEARLTNAG
jgi:hypothetical protein